MSSRDGLSLICSSSELSPVEPIVSGDPPRRCSPWPRLKRQSVKPPVPTRFLHVSGITPEILTEFAVAASCKNDSSATISAPKPPLQALFESFGALDEEGGLEILEGKRFCWVRYKSMLSAIAAVSALTNTPCLHLGGRMLYPSFAEEVFRGAGATGGPEPVPAFTTNIDVPGLYLINDFVSPEEEEQLLADPFSQDGPWVQGISRRVQHYGFTFSYETLGLRVASTPPIPPTLDMLGSRIEQFSAVVLGHPQPQLTQITANEYEPGQGIGSHVDNVECFGDSVYVLSLGAGITMTMTLNTDPARATRGRDVSESRIAQAARRRLSAKSGDGTESDYKEDLPMDQVSALSSSHPDSQDTPSPPVPKSTGEDTDPEVNNACTKRHVYLPPRSLLVLTGDARYRWCHGIAQRTYDKIHGRSELIKRQRRVSLTYREALSADGKVIGSKLMREVPLANIYGWLSQHETRVTRALNSKGAEVPAEVNQSSDTAVQKLKKKSKSKAERIQERAREGSGSGGGTNKVKAIPVPPSALELPVRMRETAETSSSPSSCAATTAGVAASGEDSLMRSSDFDAVKENSAMDALNRLNLDIEKKHVFEVYDEIALHWHHTRGLRRVYWPLVKAFLDGLPRGTLLADVGSGDGKYLNCCIEGHVLGSGACGIVPVGCDRSWQLLEVSRDTRIETLCCDAVCLPYVSSRFDAAICIAVMHHLASTDRRLSLLAELMRIVREGGEVLVQAWAREQELPEGSSSMQWYGDDGIKRDRVKAQSQPCDVTNISDSSSTSTVSNHPTPPIAGASSDLRNTSSASSSSSRRARGGGGARVTFTDATEHRRGSEEGTEVLGRGGISSGNVPSASQQDVLVPWTLVPHFATNGASKNRKESVGADCLEEGTAEPGGSAGNGSHGSGARVYQRYCHMYRRGELEELCSRIPGCTVITAGFDKGNWFVKLRKESGV